MRNSRKQARARPDARASRKAPHGPPGQTSGDPRRRDRPQAPSRVKVSSPGDMLGLVPYLLGFSPEESLVVLLIRDKKVLLTARIDLPPAGAATAVVGQFGALCRQHGASGLILFAYSQNGPVARELLGALVTGLGPLGLIDAVYVGEDCVGQNRWWSLMCTAECCPPEGTPFDLASHPMSAEAVYAGLTAAEGRQSIEASIGGPPASDVESLSALAAETGERLDGESLVRRRALMSSLVQRFLDEPKILSDTDCARLAVLADDVTVRDVAWVAMDRDDIDDHLDLWTQVVARTVSPFEVAPLCLLGMAAWISGNGALQNCCADRADRVNPRYSMTGLLREINERALQPGWWDVVAQDLRTAR